MRDNNREYSKKDNASLYTEVNALRDSINNGATEKELKAYDNFGTLFRHYGYLRGLPKENFGNNEILMLETVIGATLCWRKPFELIYRRDFINPKPLWYGYGMRCKRTTITTTINRLMRNNLIIRKESPASKGNVSKDRYYYAPNIGELLSIVEPIITAVFGNPRDEEPRQKKARELYSLWKRLTENPFLWKLNKFIHDESKVPFQKTPL